jgi:hypothetical protein
MLRGILILFSIDEVSSCGDVNILFLHLCSMTFMLGLTGVALDEDALRLDPGVPSFPLMGGVIIDKGAPPTISVAIW